jgi:hypothetical protein
MVAMAPASPSGTRQTGVVIRDRYEPDSGMGQLVDPLAPFTKLPAWRIRALGA